MRDRCLGPVDEDRPAALDVHVAVLDLLVDQRQRQRAADRVPERRGPAVRHAEREELVDRAGEVDLELGVEARRSPPTPGPAACPRAACEPTARNRRSAFVRPRPQSPTARSRAAGRRGARSAPARRRSHGAGSLNQTSPSAVGTRISADHGRVRRSSSSPVRATRWSIQAAASSNQPPSCQGSGVKPAGRTSNGGLPGLPRRRCESRCPAPPARGGSSPRLPVPARSALRRRRPRRSARRSPRGCRRPVAPPRTPPRTVRGLA